MWSLLYQIPLAPVTIFPTLVLLHFAPTPFILLTQRKNISSPQYDGTLAWSRMGSRMADYYTTGQGKEDNVKTRNRTYRTGAALYSRSGSISRPFSPTFFSKSKVERTDAAVSVKVEWARCFPGQTLPELRYRPVGRTYNAHLLPNPNAMSIGSLTELLSLPFLKKRSGLNSRGSG